MDFRFNLNSRKLKIVIKFSWKDAILAPLHASADHHARKQQDRLMAPIWHPDKSEKNPKKLPNIDNQMKNVITKNYFILKSFDKEKDSLNLKEM